jgi:hypothetical protein
VGKLITRGGVFFFFSICEHSKRACRGLDKRTIYFNSSRYRCIILELPLLTIIYLYINEFNTTTNNNNNNN